MVRKWTEPMNEMITQIRILPDGADPDDTKTGVFAVTVNYRGTYQGRSGGGYSVEHCGAELSRRLTWGWPQRFQRWQYRWSTLDEALAVARNVVNTIKADGRTWAEWQEISCAHDCRPLTR
jgi:hypothetical protein